MTDINEELKTLSKVQTNSDEIVDKRKPELGEQTHFIIILFATITFCLICFCLKVRFCPNSYGPKSMALGRISSGWLYSSVINHYKLYLCISSSCNTKFIAMTLMHSYWWIPDQNYHPFDLKNYFYFYCTCYFLMRGNIPKILLIIDQWSHRHA